VIAASLILLALLAGIAGTTVGLLRAREQRNLAEHRYQQLIVANAKTETERTRAEQNFATARTAILDLGTRINQIETGQANPRLADLARKEALDKAREHFERFREGQPDDVALPKQAALLHRFAAGVGVGIPVPRLIIARTRPTGAGHRRVDEIAGGVARASRSPWRLDQVDAHPWEHVPGTRAGACGGRKQEGSHGSLEKRCHGVRNRVKNRPGQRPPQPRTCRCKAQARGRDPRKMKQREAAIPEPGKARLTDDLDRLIDLFTETNKPDPGDDRRSSRGISGSQQR
jgi:hypothetical protein